jgi:hypothetical protein
MHQSQLLFDTSQRDVRHMAIPQPLIKDMSLSMMTLSSQRLTQIPFCPLRPMLAESVASGHLNK